MGVRRLPSEFVICCGRCSPHEANGAYPIRKKPSRIVWEIQHEHAPAPSSIATAISTFRLGPLFSSACVFLGFPHYALRSLSHRAAAHLEGRCADVAPRQPSDPCLRPEQGSCTDICCRFSENETSCQRRYVTQDAAYAPD